MNTDDEDEEKEVEEDKDDKKEEEDDKKQIFKGLTFPELQTQDNLNYDNDRDIPFRNHKPKPKILMMRTRRTFKIRTMILTRLPHDKV